MQEQLKMLKAKMIAEGNNHTVHTVPYAMYIAKLFLVNACIIFNCNPGEVIKLVTSYNTYLEPNVLEIYKTAIPQIEKDLEDITTQNKPL